MRAVPPPAGTDGEHGVRLSRLIRESWRAALASTVATACVALVVATVCLAVLATTGRAAAAEQAVLGRIDSTGTQVITVTDADGTAGLSSSSVTTLASMTGVDWAVGLGPAEDVYTSALPVAGAGVPARTFVGDAATLGTLRAGRAPTPGEALTAGGASEALGLVDGIGAVQTDGVRGPARDLAVVGDVELSADLADLATGVFVSGEASARTTLRYVYVKAATVGDVDRLVEEIPSVLAATDPGLLSVDASDSLRRLRQVVAGDLAESSRQLMLLVLGIGAGLVAITMSGFVSARRRDFGRRRALGASRSTVVVIVVAQALIASLAGVVVGTATGLAVIHGLVGALPPAAFVLGVGTLVCLSTVLAAVPAALAAALRDPVRILRVA